MRVLLVDNYDSFTYNIVDILRRQSGCTFHLVSNDQIPWDHLSEYDSIVLSPGPGKPAEAGELTGLIRKVINTHPLLGICLGHQAIAEVCGATLFNLSQPRHGYRCRLHLLTNKGIWEGIDDEAQNIQMGLYHSWAVDSKDFPDVLHITSYDQEGIIMSFEHKHLPVYGVQFHPESYMSDSGARLIENFLYQGYTKDGVRPYEFQDR